MSQPALWLLISYGLTLPDAANAASGPPFFTLNNTNTSGQVAARITSAGGGLQIVCPFGYAGLDVYGDTYLWGSVLIRDNLEVQENLIVRGSKNFQIDHPLDPANRLLTHSCVESSDRKNLYDGVIVTDENGEGTVTLPSYFEALNRDFSYQLTVLDQFAYAIVATEVTSNRFRIKTDKPKVKVSWQITGSRQDAYAKAYPMVVEAYKPASQRGRYFTPELFGAPKQMRIEPDSRQTQTEIRGADVGQSTAWRDGLQALEATVKAQQAEIELLRAELKSLRAVEDRRAKLEEVVVGVQPSGSRRFGASR